MMPMEPLTIDGPHGDVSLLSDDWRERLCEAAHATGRQEGVFGETTGEGGNYRPRPVKLRWHGGQAPYEVDIDGHRYECVEPCLDVYYLQTGKEVVWTVTDGSGVSVAGRFFTAHGSRLIQMPNREYGPVNVRDVGGWPWRLAGRSGWLRQGLLYRGSAINEWLPACEENNAFLVGTLGVKTDMDLRYADVVACKTHSDLEDSLAWLCHPINAYESFTSEQNVIWRDAIARFADSSLYPIYFHCSGGVDRTGELAFLLQGLCGVLQENLFLDYELSSLAGFPRLRSIPYLQHWMQELQAFAPLGSSWAEIIKCYMLEIGVTRKQINSIRQILMEQDV
ncbi:MAG: tyrosine-protein phosphatase [Victivallales bacterium]|nr:tyrosine-protein phosphatase [Victivallales bacterium]